MPQNGEAAGPDVFPSHTGLQLSMRLYDDSVPNLLCLTDAYKGRDCETAAGRTRSRKCIRIRFIKLEKLSEDYIKIRIRPHWSQKLLIPLEFFHRCFPLCIAALGLRAPRLRVLSRVGT